MRSAVLAAQLSLGFLQRSLFNAKYMRNRCGTFNPVEIDRARKKNRRGKIIRRLRNMKK